MTTAVGALNVVVRAGTAEFQTDMQRMAEIAKAKGNDIKAAMIGAADAGATGFKALANNIGMVMKPVDALTTALSSVSGALGMGAAAAAVGTMFTNSVQTAAGMADLAVKTGVNVEQLSRFNTVAKLSGTSIETVADMMKKLSISAVEASNGNEKLARVWNSIGLDTKELKNLGPDELMIRFGQAIQGIDPKVLQDVVKTLGGKGGSEALVFLNELNQRLETTQAKISTEFAQSAKEFEDNLVILNSRATALANTLTSNLLPALNALMGDMVKGGGFLSGLAPSLSIDFKGDLDKQLADTKAHLSHLELQRRESDDPGVWEDDIKRVEARARMIEDRIKFINGLKPKELDTTKTDAATAAIRTNNTSSSSGDGFLQGLRARIEKAQDGEYAMLRLQAAEKGVAAGAEPLIEKIITKEGLKAADQYEKSLATQTATLEFQNSLVGKSAQEIEVANLAHATQLGLQKQIQSIIQQKGALSEEAEARMTKAMETATERQVDLLQQRQAAERTWSVGANRAIQSYADTAGHVGKSTETMFSNTFRNMEDAIVQFAITGKASFTNLANGIVADVMRIYTRMAITGLIGKVGGLFGGGMVTDTPYTTPGGVGVTTPLPEANGDAFIGGRITAFASGGVVSRPTLFAMAGGAGLMGEAGPEAIMPLSRGSDGKLGVKASGGGGGNVTVNVVNQAAGTEATTRESTDSMGNRQIEILIANLVNKTISSGRADQAMKQAYNLRRVGK